MPRVADRPGTRRDTWLAVACLGCSVALLFAPARWGLTVAALLRGSVLRPVALLQENAAQGRTSRSRLRAIVAERDSAAIAAQFLPALRDENRRLRQLLALRERVGPGVVPAEVLHQPLPTDGRTLLLSAGRAAGVTPLAPVVSPDGLLGVVTEVDEATSVAMTWGHPDFRASAVTADGRMLGVVAAAASSGSPAAELEFRALSYRDTIPEGTPVITAGLGGVYPRGVPIGVIAGIAREQEGWERVYRLRPAALPGIVPHALVLAAMVRDTVPAGAFGTGALPPVPFAEPESARRIASPAARPDSARRRPRTQPDTAAARPRPPAAPARPDTTRRAPAPARDTAADPAPPPPSPPPPTDSAGPRP